MFLINLKFRYIRFYLGSIIGRKGATKMKLENDTKTEIKIPRHGRDEDIVIFGSSEEVRIFSFKKLMILYN